MKRCCKYCKITKPLDEFQKLEVGYKFVCRDCYKIQITLKADKAGKTVEDYEQSLLLGRKKYQEKKIAKPFRRETWLRRTYNISLDTYNRMLETQKGVCAICERPETRGKTKYLSVDHNHTTGEVRELLCAKCNTVLGYMDDNPEYLVKALAYLEKHSNH